MQGERRIAATARTAVLWAVLLSVALGMFQALAMAPWGVKDERAHTGYAMALADGQMPTIDTPIAIPDRAPELAWTIAYEREYRLARGEDARDTVWVANHPPGSYLPAVPGVWLGDRLGSGPQVLVWLRAANVFGAALTVLFTALLARELTGSAALGALAAGLCATVPYFGQITAQGMTDGIATAMVTGALWATARALRRGFDDRSAMLVAVLVGSAGAVRLSSALTAGVVAGVGLVIASRRGRRVLWRPALVIGVATALASGWFYVWNIARYGDPAASATLLERFDREPRATLLETATNVSGLRMMLRNLFASRIQEPMYEIGGLWFPTSALASSLILVLLTAATVAVAIRVAGTWRRRRAAPPPTDRQARGVDPAAWGLLAVGVGTAWLLTAQHVAGGGNPHARYLLVAVPAASCVVAAAWGWVVVPKLEPQPGTRAGVVATLPVAAMLAYNLAGLPEAFDELLVADWTPFGVTRLGPTWSFWVTGAGIAVAAVAYLVAVARVLARVDFGAVGSMAVPPTTAEPDVARSAGTDPARDASETGGSSAPATPTRP